MLPEAKMTLPFWKRKGGDLKKTGAIHGTIHLCLHFFVHVKYDHILTRIFFRAQQNVTYLRIISKKIKYPKNITCNNRVWTQ
jgi:hypothetical protein